MAWRKTATFHAPIEVLVLTCDVCACDIGHEDERRPRAHFQLSRHPNPGAIDDQEPAVVICSRECLRAFVANVSEPDRAPPMPPPSVVGQKRTARTQSCARLRVGLFRNGLPDYAVTFGSQRRQCAVLCQSKRQGPRP